MSKPYEPSGQWYRMLVEMEGTSKLQIYKGTLKGIKNYKHVRIIYKHKIDYEEN